MTDYPLHRGLRWHRAGNVDGQTDCLILCSYGHLIFRSSCGKIKFIALNLIHCKTEFVSCSYYLTTNLTTLLIWLIPSSSTYWRQHNCVHYMIDDCTDDTRHTCPKDKWSLEKHFSHIPKHTLQNTCHLYMHRKRCEKIILTTNCIAYHKIKPRRQQTSSSISIQLFIDVAKTNETENNQTLSSQWQWQLNLLQGWVTEWIPYIMRWKKLGWEKNKWISEWLKAQY